MEAFLTQLLVPSGPLEGQRARLEGFLRFSRGWAPKVRHTTAGLLQVRTLGGTAAVDRVLQPSARRSFARELVRTAHEALAAPEAAPLARGLQDDYDETRGIVERAVARDRTSLAAVVDEVLEEATVQRVRQLLVILAHCIYRSMPALVAAAGTAGLAPPVVAARGACSMMIAIWAAFAELGLGLLAACADETALVVLLLVAEFNACLEMATRADTVETAWDDFDALVDAALPADAAERRARARSPLRFRPPTTDAAVAEPATTTATAAATTEAATTAAPRRQTESSMAQIAARVSAPSRW